MTSREARNADGSAKLTFDESGDGWQFKQADTLTTESK